MKSLFTCLLVIGFMIVNAQKKYDCIVFTKTTDSSLTTRNFGILSFVSDSSITMNLDSRDTSLFWKNIKSIRFRKHNGFSRTVLPVSVFSASVLIGYLTSIYGTGIASRLTLSEFAVADIVYSVAALPIVTVIYFLTRNHIFNINTYEDYKRLKIHSSKYISTVAF